MPRVPLLNPQARRSGQGLGNAFDEGEARRWGEGFAKLGEGVARAGAALARMDSVNKKTADALMVARAEQMKKRAVIKTMGDMENFATSSQEYGETVRSETDKADGMIVKELEKTYGSMDSITRNAILTKMTQIGTSYDDEIEAKGIQLQTAFIKKELDAFKSESIAAVYQDPSTIGEAIASQEGFIVDLYESLGIMPDNPQTEKAIRSEAKSLYISGIEGLMERRKFADARDFVTSAGQVKVLTPEEVQSFTDVIRRRRDQTDIRDARIMEQNYTLNKRQTEERQTARMLQLFSGIDKAKKEGNFEEVALFSQQADDLATGGGLGIDHRKQVQAKSDSVLKDVSTQTGYNDIAIKFYSLNTEKDLQGLQNRVIEMERIYKLTDEDAQSWLSLIKNKSEMLKNDPERARLISAHIQYLKSLGPNEQDMSVMLSTKFNGNAFDPTFISRKQTIAKPLLSYSQMVSNPNMDLDQALSMAVEQTVPGLTAMAPATFKNTPVPKTPEEYDALYEDYMVDKMQRKNEGTYDAAIDRENLEHLRRVKRAIEATDETKELRQRFQKAQEARTEIDKALEERTVLDRLLNDSLGTGLPLPITQPANLPLRR